MVPGGNFTRITYKPGRAGSPLIVARSTPLPSVSRTQVTCSGVIRTTGSWASASPPIATAITTAVLILPPKDDCGNYTRHRISNCMGMDPRLSHSADKLTASRGQGVRYALLHSQGLIAIHHHSLIERL